MGIVQAVGTNSTAQNDWRNSYLHRLVLNPLLVLLRQASKKKNWASARQMSVVQWHGVQDAMQAAGPAGMDSRQINQVADRLGLDKIQV